jgi:intein/homing endonuclease
VLQKTIKSRRFSASFVKFKEVKLGKTKTTNAPVVRSKSYSTHDHNGVRKNYVPNDYVSLIEVHGKYVVLSCSCDDFWAVWEVALSAQGAARIEYSNGERPKDKNPLMIPGCCIAEGTLVSTDTGYKEIQNIVVGDSVLTKNGYHKVDQTTPMGVKKVMRVSLSDGSSFEATPDHRILVADGRSIRWKEVKDLDPSSDSVIKAAGARTNTKPVVSNEAARILGYMVAEGAKTLFCAQNKYNIQDFVRCFRKYFKSDVLRVSKQGVHFSIKHLRELEDLGYKNGAYSKEVPSWIMRASREEMRNFVIGAWAGDGYTYGSSATYASVSRKLVEQMQLLLLEFGVYGRISTYISGIKDSTVHLLRVTGNEQAKKFIAAFPPVRGVLNGKKLSPEKGGAPLHERLPVSLASLRQHLSRQKFSELYEGLGGEPVHVRNMLQTLGLHADRSVPIVRSLATAFVMPTPNSKKPALHAPAKEIASLLKQMLVSKIDRSLFNGVHDGDYGLTRHKLRGFANDNSELRKSPEVQLMLRDDIAFVSVVSVTDTGKKNVFDISVEQEPNFLANGVVVHNCKHLYRLGERLVEKNKL